MRQINDKVQSLIDKIVAGISIGAGTKNIGQVDVNSSALPTGAAIATKQDSLITELTAIKSTAGIKKIVDALPAGDNNIGNVDIASALPAGTNIIGNIGVSGNYTTGTAVGDDNAVVFENSAAANTQVNVDIVKPANHKSRYIISVYNPSTKTDLTCKVFAKDLTLGGGTRYSLIDVITVPKSQMSTGTTIDTHAKLIEGIFVGTDLRLVFSNDIVLGASDGFSAYARVREVL